MARRSAIAKTVDQELAAANGFQQYRILLGERIERAHGTTLHSRTT